MRFVNYCIPFLFTICTVSQLFWNRVCTTLWRNSVVNTASTVKDQRPLLHHCLFSPTHRFAHVVWIMKETNAGLRRNQTIKMAQKTTKCSAKLWQSLHCLPFDSNIRKQWMNFIFKEVPDCVSENLFLSSLHFTTDLQTRHNSTQEFQKDWK